MDRLPQGTYEIAVVERPGVDASAVDTWRELLEAANQVATRRGGRPTRLVSARWTIDADGEPVPCAARLKRDRAQPRVIALPEQLSVKHLDTHAASNFAHWLRSYYEGGTTLVASNASANLLDVCGLCTSAPGAGGRTSAQLLIDDTGGVVTAHGADAWLFLGLRIIHRVHGKEVMNDTADRLALSRRAMISAGLHHFAPDFSHGDSAVLRAQRWLHANLAVGIDLPGLCRVANLQPRTLQRRFSRATGSGPIEYAQHVRISHAQRLILRGVRIRDVPHRVGYADSSAFRRVFQRISGCSPSMYVRYVLRGRMPG